MTSAAGAGDNWTVRANSTALRKATYGTAETVTASATDWAKRRIRGTFADLRRLERDVYRMAGCMDEWLYWWLARNMLEHLMMGR